MSKILLILIGLFLFIHGLYSIWTGIKGGDLTGYIAPSDTFIARKIFGKKGANRLFNIVWGFLEIISGLILIFVKF